MALVQKPSELAEAISELEGKFDCKLPPPSTEESPDEQGDGAPLQEIIGALEHELSALLRQQASAEKRFKGQRDAVRQVNEKLLEKTSATCTNSI